MRVFGAVLMVSALLLSGAAAADASPSPITWGACPDDPDSPAPPDGECGTLRVPLDWNRPHGPSIDLAVARHRATDPAHRIGVLLADMRRSRLVGRGVRAGHELLQPRGPGPIRHRGPRPAGHRAQRVHPV